MPFSESRVIYFWFWLLGLSGIVIASNPLSNSGRRYFRVKFFEFLYPQCSAISALE